MLFTGDGCFFDVTPLAHEGHIGAWIGVLDRVLALDAAATIVPGHGPVGGKNDVRRFLGYLTLIREGARKAFDAGATEAQAREAIDLREYGDWEEANRLPTNVARLYAEFRGELDGML